MLKHKKILIGITGGIAAYKINHLVRELIKLEAEVRVIMTSASFDFVTPLTLSTLSKNSVISDFSKPDGTWNNHVELALWADAFLIAPCTANTMAKMANGICDNVLMATYLSAKCPVLFAPAMDLDMYKHGSTEKNIDQLLDYGNVMIPAEEGELASGLVGKGRMAEPETIIQYLSRVLCDQDLLDKKVLITAGPTYEAIDPVRFIGNYSSGKMGVSLAEELSRRGASVKLVIGPSSVKSSEFIERFDVKSADQMFTIVDRFKDQMDIMIMSAAVADFKPKDQAKNKIKKTEGTPTIQLVENPDILSSVGETKRKDQLLVGFALETNNELENAKSKLLRKNLDLIVLNSLNDKGAGFQSETNKVTLIDKRMNVDSFELKSKDMVSKDIVNKLLELI